MTDPNKSKSWSDYSDFLPDSEGDISLAIEDWKIGVERVINLTSLWEYSIFTEEFDEVINIEDISISDKVLNPEEIEEFYVRNLLKYIKAIENRTAITHSIRSIINNFLDKENTSENPSIPCITILLDNSGSLRWENILYQAIVAHFISEELERVGVPFEILWFTTKTWKWGRVFKKWLEEGKAPQPWRLNELRHVVYKPYDSQLKKENLGLLLREWLLKENIDWEALAWAHSRMGWRPESNKHILHISDWAPIDDATQSQNKNGILDDHLHWVLGELWKVGNLNLHVWLIWDKESKFSSSYDSSIISGVQGSSKFEIGDELRKLEELEDFLVNIFISIFK